ncbi:MAG: UbiA family prenyltransferase [Candidatus Moranbacteria bacterium]|nr:UbiA family prenyltransferase [Candidatus Moranbacteria bacterium]
MKIRKRIKNTLAFLEKGQFNLRTWLLSFLALVSTRLLLESLLLGFPAKSLESFLALFIHTFLFFLLTYLIFLFFLISITKEKVKKIASFLLWGFGIIIFPPVVDRLIFQGALYKSFYIFDSLSGLWLRFFTFFGKNPDWGITWGARINILISLIFIGIYIYLKTKNKYKVIGGVIGGYSLFFILSCFPSIVVYFLEFFRIGKILETSYSTVAGYFMTPLSVFNLHGVAIESFLAKKLALIYLLLIFVLLVVLLFRLNLGKTLGLIKNIRFPQLVFNLGLLFMGLGLGFFYNPAVFRLDFFSGLMVLNLILMVSVTWFFSVLINDLSDLKIDKISNKNRPLVKKVFSSKEYLDLAGILFLVSFFSASLVSPVVLLVVASYHLLTYVYSCYPFRLKRFPGISSGLVSIASLNFLVIGFLVFSENQTLINFPWRVYGFLFLAYSLITPLKDLKDLEGDKKDHVYTLPVLVGRENTRLIVASLLFSLYLGSVYVLNKQELFLGALFLGGISFWIVSSPRINERRLNGLVMGLAFLYGLWIVKTIFL